MEGFRKKKKKFNEAEEIAGLDVGARNQYSHQFTQGIYRRYIDREFLWAISTLLFLVAGKASRVLVDR